MFPAEQNPELMLCILYNPDPLRLGLQGRTSFFVLFFSSKARNSETLRLLSSSISFILDGRRTQRTQGRVLDVDDNNGYRCFQDYSEVKDFQKFQKSCSAPPPKNAGLGCQRGGFGLRQIRNFLLSSFGGDMSGRAGRVD